MKKIIAACFLGVSIFSSFAQFTATDMNAADSMDYMDDIMVTNIPDAFISKTSDFWILSQMQLKLNKKIGALEAEVRDLSYQVNTNYDAERLSDLQSQIAARSDNTNLTTQAQSDLVDLKSQINSIMARLQKVPELKQRLEKKQVELHNAMVLFDAAGNRIRELVNPEQKFKLYMSGAYAALISVVIIGFFILAGIDPKIRQAIFSGEAGIQFLTLFSLVIAIILFGIIGILEGKELAALLGGLSGYILGRVSPKDNHTAPLNQPPAVPPNPIAPAK